MVTHGRGKLLQARDLFQRRGGQRIGCRRIMGSGSQENFGRNHFDLLGYGRLNRLLGGLSGTGLAGEHAFGRAGEPHVRGQPESRLPGRLLQNGLIEIGKALRATSLLRRIDGVVFGVGKVRTLRVIIA